MRGNKDHSLVLAGGQTGPKKFAGLYGVSTLMSDQEVGTGSCVEWRASH